MTALLWCMVAACVLPYVPHVASVVARVRTGAYERSLPREQAASLTGWGKRAVAAQANAWEALPVFAVCAFVAHTTGADPTWSAALGGAFLAARLGHTAAYLADLPTLRSAMFGIANLCNLGLVWLASAP